MAAVGTFAAILAAVRRACDQAGVPWALIGGIAMVARVGVRATADVDALIVADAAAVHRLNSAMAASGLAADDSWPDMAALGLLKFRPASGQAGPGLDLIVAEDAFHVAVVVRATPVELLGTLVPTATVEDLLLLKLLARRNKDIEDVLLIKDALATQLHWPYVRATAEKLGVGEALQLYFGARAG